MKSYIKFLSRNKGYTIIDVFGLAVSFMFLIIIGAYIWQERHIDSQHSKLDRMYLLGMDMRGEKITGSHWHMVKRLTDAFPEIESATALVSAKNQMLTATGEPVNTNLLYADSSFFGIFDFGLEQGDRMTALDAPNSVVVTREYARKIWGDIDPIGQSLRKEQSDPDPLIVTAVMEPLANTILEPHNGEHIDIVVPYERIGKINPTLTNEGMNNAIGADVLLLAKDGYDLTLEQQKYHDFAKEFFWILQLPEADIIQTIVPYDEFYFSEYQDSTGSLAHGDRKLVNLLFLFGLVILLFALMNYVNLTVALSGYRAKEMATRQLLGESRIGIMAKLIVESLALCLVSFVIGALLAWLAWPYAESLLETKIYLSACINATTIAATAGVILIMGVLAGIVPAWLISSAKPIDIVRGTFRRQTKMVFSKVFIVVQNVITIVMIASALTMYMQVSHLINAPLGYNTDNVLLIPNRGNSETFMQRVAQLPGVEAVTACQGTPLDGGNNETNVYNVNGEKRTLSFQVFIGDENYMKVFGLGLDRDNNTTNTQKTYLNHQAVRELGISEDATSATFLNDTRSIDGILTDFTIRGILEDQHPIVLIIRPKNELSNPWGFAIKVIGDKDEVARQVKEIFYDMYHFEYDDPDLYLHDQIKTKFKAESNLLTIVTIFAAIALIISLLGLTAMSTYFVQQRQREIAIKKVFGCESNEMLMNIVCTFLTYIGIAFVIACPLIYYLMHSWLANYSYHIPLYWWIYAISGLICVLVSALSVFMQSYRAANANPVKALYQN